MYLSSSKSMVKKSCFPLIDWQIFIWCHCLLPYWIWPTYRLSLLFASLPDRISAFAVSKSHLFNIWRLTSRLPVQKQTEKKPPPVVSRKSLAIIPKTDRLSLEIAGNQLKVCFHSHWAGRIIAAVCCACKQKVRHFLFWFSGSEFLFFFFCVMTWKVKVAEQQRNI